MLARTRIIQHPDAADENLRCCSWSGKYLLLHRRQVWCSYKVKCIIRPQFGNSVPTHGPQRTENIESYPQMFIIRHVINLVSINQETDKTRSSSTMDHCTPVFQMNSHMCYNMNESWEFSKQIKPLTVWTCSVVLRVRKLVESETGIWSPGTGIWSGVGELVLVGAGFQFRKAGKPGIGWRWVQRYNSLNVTNAANLYQCLRQYIYVLRVFYQ